MTNRPRKRYRDVMNAADTESMVRAALVFRKALLLGKQELKPFNEQYRLLDDMQVALDRMLETITGRAIDYRARNFGLLPDETEPWRPS